METPCEKLIDGIYNTEGVPHCMGGKKMAYVKSDPVKGHAYVCPPGGCHLKKKNSGAMLYCDFDTWEDPTRDIRLFGTIRKASEEWKVPVPETLLRRTRLQEHETSSLPGKSHDPRLWAD